MARMTHTRLASSLILIASIVSAPAALAQSDGTRGEASLTDEVLRRVEDVKADDRAVVQSQPLVGRSGFAPSLPVFQLSTEQGETEVSLGISAEIGRTTSQMEPTTGDDRRTSSTTRLYLLGFAPVAEDDEDRFVNLADPVDGSRLTVGFVHYFSNYTLRRSDIVAAREVRVAVISNCLRQTVAAWQGGQTQANVALAADYLRAYEDLLAMPRTLPEGALLLVNEDPRFASLPPEVKKACAVGEEGGPENTGVLVERFGQPEFQDILIRSVTGNAPTYFFGADATVGRKSYSFLDREAFANESESNTGYEIAAFGGIIGGSGNWSARVGISHARTYADQDSVELCRSVVGSTDILCLSGADGPPTRNNRTILSLEGRQLFRLANALGNIGIAPELAIDVDDGEYTVDVPIYLARNADGQLNGGVRVSYSSDENDVAFGIFVGVPFNILN